MKRLNVVLAALALMLVGSVAVFAQNTQAPAAPDAGAAPAVAAVKPPATAPKASPPAPATAPKAPAAAAAPATNAATRNIRFQFDGIPYPDVLERFAQMVNKPLVADTNIQGTLTYNDPQPYNYQEAMDTLNLILSMKGMMLMEDGHYLRLVPFKQLPQMPVRILRGVDPTGDVRPGEIVTVVLEVKNLDTKEVGEAVLSMLSNAGSIAPLSKGRGLIITDRLGNIQRIRSLMSAIDNEAVADRQMKAFTLLHASGAVVSDLINRTFGAATAPKRTQFNPQTKQLDTLPADPNDYVTAVYDDASRTLVLFGPRTRLELAEELISKFEDKEGGGGEVRIYYPQITKADELALMIRQAVPGVAGPGETAAAAATKARVIPDLAQNRLIVAAPLSGQLDQIEAVINKLDKPVHGTGGSSYPPTRSTAVQVTKVFRTRSSEAASVAKILTEALTKRLPNGVAVPTANVTVEPGSQSVVVTGSPGDVQTAVDIITQLETGSSMPVPQQTRFIDVGTLAEAKRIMPLVEQIYRSQVTDSLGGQVAHAKIIADAETGRLIVTASDDHLKRIEEIVKQLKAEKVKPQPRRLQIIPLKNLHADTGLASLNNLLTERMSDKRFEDLPKPLLLPDAANNRLLVTATDEQFKEIQDLVKTLDVAPEKTKREMSVIPVQSKSANDLISLTTQLMTQLGEDQANPQLAPKLIPDASGKQIIVLATAKDLARITNLVQQLDSTSVAAVSRQFRGIELFSRTASELTPLVQQLYQEQLKGQLEPAGGPATLLAEAKNNRIMVSGSEKEIARVEAIIRQLDPEGRKGAKDETRVIRLKAGLATDLASLVEKSLNAQGQSVKIVVEPRSNSLVVTGESSAVEAASQLINQLDTRSDVQPRELRILELKQGDANSVAPMVTSVSTEMLKDQHGPEYVPQTKIVPDANANRLIITGPKDELKTISSVVEQLDQAPEAAGGARVFKLTMADAATVLPVVSNAMLRFDARSQPIRRVTVSADRESNSIIVAGPRADLQDAQTIIERLDKEGVEKGRELKIIDVRTDDPDALAALALKVFTAQNTGRNVGNVVSITPEPSGKRLIVLAPPTVLPQVEAAIATLDAKPEQGARELQTVELKNAAATELLPVLNRIYAEQNQGKTTKPATIYPDGSGSRLMVYGTRDQATAVRQIVETLESQERAPRETKIFDLGKLAEAQRILPLAQQLYKDQFGSNPGSGPADAQMVSDGKTGRLIVSARTNQLAQIEEIITRLQVNPTTNQPTRETRAFDVGSPADVQRLLPLIQQLYQDQWKDKMETDPADAQIMPDAKTGRIIVTGKPEHLQQIEVILKQLNAGKARGDVRDTRVYDLTTANAMELATTVRSLYLEQAKARLGDVPPDTLILPDATANRLIVVGDTNELENVEDIIKKLDKVGAQSASVRVFKLKSAEPAQVSQILSSALVRYDSYGRPQKRISVVADAKSRTLIATGDPKELQGLSVIIEQLDSAGAQPERKMKVVQLKSGRAAEMSPQLRQLYNDQIKSQPDIGTTEILILEDTPSNQLIISATEAQLALLEKILGELQTAQANQPQRETKMIDVGQSDELQRLLPMVQQLYQDRWRDKGAGDPADAQIISDPKNARFIVTAKTNHIAEIEAIVAQLRAGITNAPRDTRIFDLTTASAVELAATLRSLYLEQAKTRAGASAQDTLILPDVSANRLIVTGATNELDVVEDLIQKLDKVSAQSGTVRVFKLKYADPAKVIEILGNALTSYDTYGRARRRVGVTLDAKTRSIIVAGDPKELQALQNAAVIIEQLDNALGQQSERKIKVIPLKQAKAAEMSPKVRQLYNDQLASKPELTTSDVLILEDAPGNQLILAGSDAQLALIEQIIAQLTVVPADVETRDTRVYELTSTSAPELATTVKSLYQEQLKTRPTSPVSEAIILPDVTANRLVVSGGTNDLKIIDEIIQKLDKSEVQTGRTRVFKLKSAEAEQVATILSTSLVQINNYGRSTPRVSVGTDTQNNLLIVSGAPQDLQAAAIIVEQMDSMLAKEPRQMRTVTLKTGLASEVATRVKSLYQDQLKGRPKTGPADAVILGDDVSSRLILTATETHMKLIEEIIGKLQETGEGTGRQMRVVNLQRNSATSISAMVSQLFARQVSSEDQNQRLAITASADDRVLVIDAAGETLTKVEQLVKTLDGEEALGKVEVRTYQLPEGNATELAPTLARLFTEKGGQAAAGLAPRFEADAAANIIMVAATKEQFVQIDKLIDELKKTAQVANEIRTFRLKTADPNQVADVLETMLSDNDTTGPGRGGRRGRRMQFQQYPFIPPGGGGNQAGDVKLVRVAPAPLLNAVVVQGPPEKLMVAEKLIQNLDGDDAAGRMEMRTYQVPEGSATDLAPTLARLFAERTGQPQRPPWEQGSQSAGGLTPRFEADAVANVLMVAATKEQFTQIEKLIEEIKKNAQVASEMRTFKLQHGDPTQIAEVLQAMLTENEPGQPGQFRPRRMQWRPGVGMVPAAESKGLRISPAPSLNALIVQGPPDKLALAEKLIQTLDKPELEGKSVIQTVHLKKAHAEDLALAVGKTLTNRWPNTRIQRMSVTPVAGPNSLLLNGPSDAVQEVMQIIRDLDQESEDDEIKVHIYKLENGNAKEVSAVIEQLLQSVTRSQMRLRSGRGENGGGAARIVQASVAVDDRSNSLVISGTPAHFKVVEQMLQVLDKVPERSERDVHFVWLRNAKAFEVVSKLEAVFAGRPEAERPVIEADTFNNSITIIGKRGDVVQIQDLVNRLDESSKDTSLQVRFRPMDRIPVDQMAKMLENIYPQMSPGRLRMVDKLTPPKAEKPAPITAPLGTNQPGAKLPATTPGTGQKPEEQPPEVVIAIDKDANSLILSGPTHELDQIDRIISDLSFSYVSSDAEFKVFPMKEADPVIVARTLSELFKPEQIQVQQPPHQQAPQQAQQPPAPGQIRTITPAPKITVVAEPRTRSVIVRAKPTDFALLESLVKQLDVAGLSAQLEYRLITLTNAPPEKVVPLVQQMVTQLNLVRPGEPLTVTPDARTRGLLVVARDTVMKQVEAMIRSLDTPAEYAEAEVFVVSLKKASAPQLAVVLQNMLKPGTAGELTPEARELQEQVRRLKIQSDQGKSVLLDLTKPIKILADPATGAQGGNRLILSSTPDNLKALAAVVEMMDTAAITEGVNVKLVHLLYADAASVQQTLGIIFTQGQRLATGPGGRAEPEGTHGKALVNPLNVAVDPRSNTLVLSGRKESLDLAEKIISDLDRKVERFTTEVKLFRLKHASAIRLAPLLQSVFTEGPAVPGTEGLSTQVTRLRAAMENDKPQVTETTKTRPALMVQADDTSNILIVSARFDTLPLIEAVITQLDIPSASGMDNIRIYPLDHADAVTIQKIVTDLYSGPRMAQMRVEDKPNITIDERTRALIVSGNEKAFAIIDSLIAQLDKTLPLELRDIRILPLENADAAEVAASLQRLLDARVTQRTSLSKAQADSMRVLVIGEPRSNSLLIAGGKDSFELVESLAKALDHAPPALSGRIRLVPLAFADARFLSTALANLFTQRYQSAKSPDVQRNRPIIVPDPRSNSLLVAAGVDDNQTIDDLVQKLDRKLEDPAMVLTVLALRHNDAAKVAATLEGVFTARQRSRIVPGQPQSPQDQVEIQTDSLNNALVISASKENVELMKGLLEKIDVEPAVPDGLVQTFVLQFADAQRVAIMLRSLVQQGLYRPGMPVGVKSPQTQREAMAVTVDPRSNTLIVSASPENLLIIKELIRQVDSKDFTEWGNIKLYALKHAKASSLSTTLEQFFRAKRAGDAVAVNAAERSIPVVVIPDDRVNSLLVTGSKESFDAIERIIQQLDSEDTMARMNFRVFPLKQTTATKLQVTLQRLFANRPPKIKGEPPEPITVVADAWANALIVGASIDDMGMVTTLLDRLDSEQAQLGLTVQVFPLAKADARRVAQTVQSLYRDGAPGMAFPVVVSADDRMNALIVSAGESDIKRITDLVKKLDTDQVARVSEIRIFPLQHARADALSTILNSALNTKPTALTEQNPNSASLLQFITRTGDGQELVTSALREGVLITPDGRMNSLIVSAPVDHMGLLEQIITQLDSSSPQQAKIKVFTLANADARQMAELLMSLFRLQPQGGAPAPGQRAIQYTLVKHNSVPVELVDNVDDPPVEGGESEVASAVVGTDEQNALHVTVDPRTNSLLVGGTEHYVALVSEVIQNLDSSSAQERKSEVYRLKNGQAPEVQTALRSFLDQERQRITQILGQDAVGTAQRMLEHEVAIVAEPVSNTLLLSANPRYFDQVRQLIDQLDQPQPQVLIQVLLAEVTLDSTRNLGIEWNLSGSIENNTISSGTALGVARDLATFGGFSALVTGNDYKFLLRALEDSGRLEVLSRPQILTADNKPASITVGQQVPLVTDSRVGSGPYNNDVITTYQYRNVGVSLTVTPRIGSDGAVKMEVSTTNSALSSSGIEVGSSGGTAIKAPIINERRAMTSISVQSGQTIIIGGLISTSDDMRMKKVPFLGDIPLLGLLFRSSEKINDRKELLILLTPQVLLNVNQEARVTDAHTITQEQLDRSTLKDQIKQDQYHKQLLEPLFPEKKNGTADPNQNIAPAAPGKKKSDQST